HRVRDSSSQLRAETRYLRRPPSCWLDPARNAALWLCSNCYPSARSKNRLRLSTLSSRELEQQIGPPRQVRSSMAIFRKPLRPVERCHRDLAHPRRKGPAKIQKQQ